MTGKRVSIVSTFILLFALGIPVWWHTTTTYRSTVDFSKILAYQEQFNDTNIVQWPLFTDFIQQNQNQRKQDHKVVKTATEYCLSFTLLNSDPSSSFVIPRWDFQTLYKYHLQSFVDQISDIANFTVQSKISHYATLLKPPTFDRLKNQYIIPSQSLSEYINPNEWKLDTTSTNQPTLNFIIFIPSQSQSPLYIDDDSKSNSFLIPQWGGIIIHNVLGEQQQQQQGDKQSFHHVDLSDQLQDSLVTFRYQLQELLGIEQTKEGAKWNQISEQQLHQLIVQYTAENLNVTINTLTSLCSLINSMPNMKVLDNIKDEVANATAALDRAHQALASKDYRSALHASKIALDASETAFFDKNMLSQLYFPDEHKYAVYTPLFVPVCFPIIAGVIQEVKNAKAKRKAKQQ
ncbi:hypothetical protein SAMD00019534_122350 [Acytostelium subglobosum LB1]|uniref:hypothetical protein n=1 Tax=Acytostelium subglobosum LB1 TaxID=1410327 RepID=UPI000644F4E8|nr:hypothetical protein SAMD00019534_122350 [Acytostelium subglobosum LB1]GAM29059.1 hypothetical protein SAMD00019534_122350 [Acytostelium subglobosum LB1]|eukprot:XP_012748065.1 hypothetical protein SAMD00019534_122350 [Acytostelium subglobosum LB1]